MAEQDTTEEVDEEEREEFAWASQTPTTRLAGTPTALIYAGNLDDGVEQNDTSFGLIVEEPEVVGGDLFVNQAKGDDGTVKDVVDEDSTVPTDYRIADEEDEDASFDRDGNYKTDEQSTVDGEAANTYEGADGFGDDTIVVWYNGLSGQRLSRLLDFNGQPYARWTDDGYLVKGLYQCAEGWRDRSTDRGEMARSGKAPRVARAPILRQRIEKTWDGDEVEDVTLLDEPREQRIIVDLSRAPSGRGYRVHAFDAEQFEDEFGSLDAEVPRNDSGYVDSDDIDSAIEWNYEPMADEILEQAEYAMHMYTGDGWQDEPDDWSPQSTSEVGSFGISTESGDEETFPNAEEQQFIEEVTQDLKGTGMTPSERYEGGIAGLVGKHADNFSSSPDVDELREAIYAEVGHLDADDLE